MSLHEECWSIYALQNAKAHRNCSLKLTHPSLLMDPTRLEAEECGMECIVMDTDGDRNRERGLAAKCIHNTSEHERSSTCAVLFMIVDWRQLATVTGWILYSFSLPPFVSRSRSTGPLIEKPYRLVSQKRHLTFCSYCSPVIYPLGLTAKGKKDRRPTAIRTRRGLWSHRNLRGMKHD